MGDENEFRDNKVMVVSRLEEGCSVTIGGDKTEEVQSLRYFGSISY